MALGLGSGPGDVVSGKGKWVRDRLEGVSQRTGAAELAVDVGRGRRGQAAGVAIVATLAREHRTWVGTHTHARTHRHMYAYAYAYAYA